MAGRLVRANRRVCNHRDRYLRGGFRPVGFAGRSRNLVHCHRRSLGGMAGRQVNGFYEKWGRSIPAPKVKQTHDIDTHPLPNMRKNYRRNHHLERHDLPPGGRAGSHQAGRGVCRVQDTVQLEQQPARDTQQASETAARMRLNRRPGDARSFYLVEHHRTLD